MGYAAADGPVDGLAGEQAVDEPGGKAVASADSVIYLDLALRDVNDLVFVERNRSPGVAAGGVRRAQRAGDQFQVGIGRRNLAQHLLITGDGQLGEVLADAFDSHAEHGGEVFFVAQQQVSFANQSAVDLLSFGLAAEALPKGVAVVEVVGDRRRVAAGGVHRLSGHFSGRSGERGEDAASVKALRAVLGAED